MLLHLMSLEENIQIGARCYIEIWALYDNSLTLLQCTIELVALKISTEKYTLDLTIFLQKIPT